MHGLLNKKIMAFLFEKKLPNIIEDIRTLSLKP
jgi:hypothetical protein